MSDLAAKNEQAWNDFREALDLLAGVLADIVRADPVLMLGHVLTQHGLQRGLSCASE